MAHSNTSDSEPSGRKLYALSLAALGIVFGDIGTSPLYAIRECFFGEYAVSPTPANILGVLSLIFWALVVVIAIKYLVFILRADNRGEGGILALMALTSPSQHGRAGPRPVLVILGLFGAALLYGDGMITPAISVLSAVEGLHVATPLFEPYLIPITIGILIAIFIVQPRGTARIGALFGPVTLVWFITLGALGIGGLLRAPRVLAAISPSHAMAFFSHNGVHGVLVLGAVFLAVTGGEALYADMGHFGRRPIRVTWFAVVLPCLLLNYFGQGALLLEDPAAAHQPFYRLAPTWGLYPLVVLATAATIIASQAVISGCFSLTRQAIQLGYCPRLAIKHTSDETIGQIYVGPINWVLMIASIGLVLGFRTSSRLAAAYGVAVATTMVITTMLFYVVARRRWGWSPLLVGPLCAVFLGIDLAFFAANVVKIEHGGWFPLVVAGLVFTLLSTWKHGREILWERLRATTFPLQPFIEDIAANPPVRVPGAAVFMTGNPTGVPPALLHNLKHNKVLHEQVALLTVLTEEVPCVSRQDRLEVEALGAGLWRVIARYGFMETPNVWHILARAREAGLPFDVMETSFFLGRETLIPTDKPGMALWRERLFAFLSRNAQQATAFFNIPANRVVELGTQIEF